MFRNKPKKEKISQEDKIAVLEASEQGQFQTLSKYIKSNTLLVNVTDKEGKTPLHHTALNAHFECVQLLLQYGAEYNAEDDKGWNPLHCGAQSRDEKIWMILLQQGDIRGTVHTKDCSNGFHR
jgi:ankyrin repeat protein